MANDTDKKLDSIIQLLEDSFILQALTAKVRREDIRAILGIAPARISKIAGGLKRAKGRNADAGDK
jgi:hypothetical protein